MDALKAAQFIYERTIKNLVGEEEDEGELLAALEVATFCATLAQAEATRPRWVQVGSHVINLAQVAFINLNGNDPDDNPRVVVGFATATAGRCMALHFDGEDYEQAVITLSNALYGCMVEAETEAA